MRTTVTLESDVEKLLRDSMRRTKRSLKETLNEGLRAGLRKKTARTASKPLVVKASRLEIRPEYANANFNQLAADLEDEAFLEKTRRLETTLGLKK